MIRTVRRGIDSVKELEKVECKEVFCEEERWLGVCSFFIGSDYFPSGFDFEWDNVYPGVALELLLLVNLGFAGGTNKVVGGSFSNF